MKKITLILCLLFGVAQMVVAQNYFHPGTVWTNYAKSTLSDPNPSLYYYAILDEVMVDEESVMPFVFYTEQNPDYQLYLYIRTEGEKVYGRLPEGEDQNWYLMYDFGLQVGEEATVTSFYCEPFHEGLLTSKVVCLEREVTLENQPELWMKIEGFVVDEDGERNEGDRYWLMGAGTLGDVTWPCMVGLSGYYNVGTIDIVSNSGEILYRNSQFAGVEETSVKATVVTVSGQVLSVVGAEPGTSVKVYSASGSLIESIVVSETGVEVSLPSKGIYLVEAGEASYKVVI